jgi:hypothetical protein
MKCNYSVFIFLMLIVAACRYENKEDFYYPEKQVEEPLPDTVSFSSHIIPLFRNECSTKGCHTGASPEGNLSLDEEVAYANLSRKGSGYIDTRNPDFSVLYASVISVNSPMPPDRRLSERNIQLIYKWIQQGARNN